MHLNKFRTLLLIMSLCALTTNSLANTSLAEPQTPKPEDAIQNTFSQYRKALLDGDGAKAAELVDSRTVTWYSEILTKALEMPREKFPQLDFMAKFMVLRLRHEFNKSELEKMNGRELIKIGVENGWISKAAVSNVEKLATIRVDTFRAAASIPEYPDAPAFYFLNESGQWKLALWRSFELANRAMQSEVTKSGLTEEQFILRTIDALSSKKIDERILSGPIN